MKTIASALAAAMLFVGPIAAPSSAFAGIAAGSLSEAMPQGEHSAIQDVRHHRRRIVRHERRLRHERRAVRRCYRRGHCTVVYVVTPIWITIPIWGYY